MLSRLNTEKKKEGVSKELKRPLIYYLVSGVLFSLVISSGILLAKYNDSLQETVDKLERVKGNLLEMKAVSSKLDMLTSRIKTLLPSDLYATSVETRIFITLDGLKSRLNNPDINIANLEEKGDMLSLPVNMKGRLKTYMDFVNDIGYLMSLRFPFFEIEKLSLSIDKTEKGAAVVYVIDGRLKMPKKGKYLAK